MGTDNIAHYLMNAIKRLLSHTGIAPVTLDRLEPLIYITIIAAVSFIVAEIAYHVLQQVIKRIVKVRKNTFLSKIIEHNTLRRQTQIIPPLMMTALLPLALSRSPMFQHYIVTIAWIYFIIMLTRAIAATIKVVGETAFSNNKYHNRPIKGFVQVAIIIVYIIMTIMLISILTDKSPLYLIGGLGAFAAVLMLITKDSIMGFVGGFLLLENDMIRIGDWIEMPGGTINGTVFDISLTIVKIRNFDNTIATIPPYTLINESFINWRGMSDTGARRIARGYTIKFDNIKPCDNDYLEKIKGLDSNMDEYIARRKGGNENTAQKESGETVETNVGVFRTYADIYLRHHPRIRKDMLIMVRTLEPTANGLPIQFYCFTDTSKWEEYEGIQSQIMEHFASVLPLFELYPYQNTSSRDTIISGMLEGNYPIKQINGMPYKIENDDNSNATM